MTYLCVLVFFVFFAGIAMTVNEGLWSNAINALLIILSGQLAFALGPTLGAWGLEKLEKGDELAWYFGFAGVWLVFFASMMSFRVLAERISKTRMRFIPPLASAAGPIMGLFVSVLFTSFFTYTLLQFPIKAGDWTFPAGSTWQETTMSKGSIPMYTLLKATIEKEGATIEFN